MGPNSGLNGEAESVRGPRAAQRGARGTSQGATETGPEGGSLMADVKHS